MPSFLTRFTTAILLTTALFSTAVAQSTDSVASEDELIATAPKLPPTHVFTIAPDDHLVGEADAPATLIIYASVTCPHCSEWFNDKWPTIKTDFVETGKANVVMREFPTEPARMAMTGFILANCAPEGEFMDNIEYQMKIQKDLFERLEAGDGKAAYEEMAAKAGMETEEEMTACFKNESAFNHVVASMDRAEAAKLKGVPAFYINGAEFDQKTTVHEALTALSDGGVSKMPDELSGK